MSESIKYFGIASDALALKAYRFYSFMTGKKLLLCDEGVGADALSGDRIGFYKNTVGRIKGLWYSMQREVLKNEFIVSVEKSFFVRLTALIFRNKKVLNFFKKDFASLHYSFLRDSNLVKTVYSGSENIFILPNLKKFRKLSEKCMDGNSYIFSNILAILFILCSLLSYLKFYISCFVIKPAFGRPLKRKILCTGNKVFCDERTSMGRLVDGIAIKKDDIVLFSKPGQFEELARNAEKKNYPVFDIFKNKVNIFSKAFLYHFFFMIFLSPFLFSFGLLFSPEALGAFNKFVLESKCALKIFSLIVPDYFMDVDEQSSITRTIWSSFFGTRTVFQTFGPCNAPSRGYNSCFLSHNVLFTWESFLADIYCSNYMADEVYGIGCFYSNVPYFNAKNSVLGKLNLKSDRPIVTFFDNIAADNHQISLDELDEFIQSCMEYAKNNRDVRVVFRTKTKNALKKYFDKFMENGVIINDLKDGIFIADIIKASEVCVGIALNNAIMISLFMRAKAVFYDTTDCFEHPFVSHEGTLVVRERKLLFERINGLLSGNLKMPEMPEIEKQNVGDTDPVMLLRDYIITGKMDKKYRLV